MASIPRRLLLQSRQCPSRIRPRPKAQWTRHASTPSGRDRDDDSRDDDAMPKVFVKLTPTEEGKVLADINKDLSELGMDESADAQRKGKQGFPIGKGYNLESDEQFDIEEDDRRKIMSGFWAEGEESMGPDEDYFGDDLTSHGHGQLEEHRELREYARLIAWELPLLNQLARPFELPTNTTPFRFRYTSYLGESHPAINKVVVDFNPSDLSLSAPQIAKLIKLAGPRYNPSNSTIKLSCESFTTQAQNKRFLGETIQGLLKEAKDSKDTFEDVPFDFRHQKVKKWHAFPPGWALTPERKKYLEEKRASALKMDDERKSNGQLIDGKTVIETSLPLRDVAAQLEREAVLAGGGKGRESRQGRGTVSFISS